MVTQWEGICPFCGQAVALKEAKDFESFTGAEMKAHYEQRHPKELAAALKESRGLGMPYYEQQPKGGWS